tara:strand:- start:156 stop:1316 length:1161 start_codon:yes stop_codon:yes gene_type:complete
MTVRVNKQPLNIREKLPELERPIGVKGSELLRTDNIQEARDAVRAGRKNIIINGDMRVSQRNADNYSANFDGGGKFIVDRFRGYNTNGVARGVQSTNAPFGFSHSLKYEVTTANNPRTTSAWSGIYYTVEGYDAAHLKWNTVSGGQPATLSFWVRSSVVGRYSVHVRDLGTTRSFAAPYFINEPDIWEHKKVTIIPPNSGTFGTTNNVAFSFFWSLDMGFSTGYETDNLGYWEANGNKFGVEGMAPLFSTAGNAFYMTGVQLEVGGDATDFERRHYGEELALCQRYFFKLSNSRLIMGYKRHDSQASFELNCPVPMRAAPTATLTADGTFTNFQSNFNTTQSSPHIYEWNAASGNRALFRVNSNWGSTHTYVPSWEGFTAEFSAEL